MDNARLWLRDNCNLEKLKNLKSVEDVKDVGQIKSYLYIGMAFLAIIYLIQRAITNFKSKTSSRTATRSPDPEKPSGTKIKAPERPFGGKKNAPPKPFHKNNFTHHSSLYSMDPLRLETPNSKPLPRLVCHGNKTPTLPSLPLRTQIQHQPRSAQHGLERMDRTR